MLVATNFNSVKAVGIHRKYRVTQRVEDKCGCQSEELLLLRSTPSWTHTPPKFAILIQTHRDTQTRRHTDTHTYYTSSEGEIGSWLFFICQTQFVISISVYV